MTINIRRPLQWFCLVTALCLTPYTPTLFAQPSETACPSGHTLQHTFSSGAAWDMCWQTSVAEGVVLSNIYYTTPAGLRRRVLGNAAVAQIETEFDDGTRTNALSSTSGLGGSALQTLGANHCPGGTLHSSGGQAVLCSTERDRGYILKHPTVVKQGKLFELINISVVDNRNYVIRWRFADSGIIDPAIGLTGSLPKTGGEASYGWPVTAENVIGVAFTDHYFWRLDFDIADDASNDVAEEYASLPSANRLEKLKVLNPLTTESARSTDWENKRYWRIRDGSVGNGNNGFISYELVTLNHIHQNSGNQSQSWLASDIFFTRYNACEQLATNNPTTGCGSNVSTFVNGENINGADIVTWYRLSYHHLPRDEDVSRMPIRWNGFELLPRDWSATNPML